MPDNNLRIMIVAGEASGDLHAAKLVRALKEVAGRRIEFFGAAGPLMRNAGVEPVVMSDELSIVGLLEIGRALPMFIGAYRKLTRDAKARKPDVAVLVDFPDFNLKLAKSLKRLGIKVVYYISPQLWAWRSYRVRTIGKYVDLLITILPFENDWYLARGIRNVEYVGSPLATEVRATMSKEAFCSKHGVDPLQPIVALLPGSRKKEITRILPVMLGARERMAASNSHLQFVVAAGDARNASVINEIGGNGANVVVGETYDLLNAADVAAVTSGTATLETAIIGTPMVIVYKTSRMNYALLRPLISVEYFGLANLIAGKQVAKELIQSDLSAQSLAAELSRMLESTENTNIRGELAEATEKLGHGGASRRAAEAILRIISSPAGP